MCVFVCVLRILDEFHAHMSTQMITVIGAGNANKATNEASTRYILKHTYTHYANLHTLDWLAHPVGDSAHVSAQLRHSVTVEGSRVARQTIVLVSMVYRLNLMGILIKVNIQVCSNEEFAV